MIHLWVLSTLVASLFLSGCSTPALTPTKQVQAVQTPTAIENPLSPEDRKAMEDIALLFAKKYYTYTPESYLQVNQSLLPLLTPDYQQPFQKITEDGALAAQAVKAQSGVESVQILAVDKLSPSQGKVYLQYKALVSNNGKETENRYSATLDLRKKDNQWKINAILSEQPVEFLNIQNLL